MCGKPLDKVVRTFGKSFPFDAIAIKRKTALAQMPSRAAEI
jgi:hypothetical protein